MMKESERIDRPVLRPVEYHILVALGDGPRHGYAIMQEIEERTRGAVRLLPGTLYATIKRMLSDGALEECAAPADERNRDERRRYYRITRKGRGLALAETERMAMLVRVARRKGFVSAG